MIDIKHQSIELERTGIIVHVSNDPIAKLMYYLDCINCLTDFYIPKKVHDYKNRKNLSFEEENNVLHNASVLCPSLFIGKIIFNIPSMCPIADNQLYNVSEVKSRLTVTPQLMISGKIARTIKIMTYKNRWIEGNYYSPIKLYTKRIEAIKNGTVERFRPKNVNIHKQNHQNNNNYYHRPRPQSVQRTTNFNNKMPYNQNYHKHNNYNNNYHYQNPTNNHSNNQKPYNNHYQKPINNHSNNQKPYNNHYQKPKINVHPKPNNNNNNNYKPRPQSVQRQRYQNLNKDQNIYFININVQSPPKTNDKPKIEEKDQETKQQKETVSTNSKSTPQKESMSNSKSNTTNDDKSSNTTDCNDKNNKSSKACLLI